jgi:hypothetical protein
MTTQPLPLPIENEADVPSYTLPDPLVHEDGTPVRDVHDWRERRRPALVALFEREMYGSPPRAVVPMRLALHSEEPLALDGVATRLELRVTLGDAITQTMTVLAFLPNAASAPAPLFLGLNFHGNHTITTDLSIALPDGWVPNDAERGIADHRARTADRGIHAQRWPVEQIIARGYGVATVYCGDIDPDWDDGFHNGVHALVDIPAGDWGTVGAWAWGLSRALDALATVPQIDVGRVAVVGHSRLGKAALWAAAQDRRFALAISNNSGSCGAALARRRFGETLAHINTRFPHWFRRAFHRYNGREDALPFDQHTLIALIAPRPVYVASAADDLWADPRGEFLGARHADAVYRLLGTDGIAAHDMPPLDEPVMSTIGYHIRPGGHDITPADWQRFMDFADRHL